jgi:acyl-CoA reductase-like NAD-dependent aldehyde dehydrogenase
MTQTASSAVTTDGRFASLDPRTGEVVAHHPVHDAKQVQDAVAQARRASNWWQELGFAGRKERLDAWRRLLVKRLDEAASLISAETGKPAADAKLELVIVIDHLHWAAKNAERVLRKRRVPAGLLMSNQAATLEYLPVGVVGVIGPWNYPAFTPMGSIAYALAAGNTVVFKPSELTPGVGTWLSDTLAEVVPEHPVLSVVTGFGETGAALCRSGVDKLAFTGSTETGKRVMAACAETLTPVLVECGGKDALIVDYDADVQLAADAAVWGAMSNAGQTCVGVERVYVHEDVADEFTAAVRKLAAKLRPGGDPGADLGPITMPAQVDIIRGHVQDALPGRRGRVGAAAVRRAGGAGRRAGGLDGHHRGDLRADDHHQPGAGRGRGHPAGQRRPLRPRRHRLLQGPRRGAGPSVEGRHGVDQQCGGLRGHPDPALRRRRRLRLRPHPRRGRPARVRPPPGRGPPQVQAAAQPHVVHPRRRHRPPAPDHRQTPLRPQVTLRPSLPL